MRMKCVIGNRVLTRKAGGSAFANERYEMGKYCDMGRGVPYYVGEFVMNGDPNVGYGDGCCGPGEIWTHGRLMGDKERMPIFIGYAVDFVERIEIPRQYADELKRRGGKGDKPRYVMCAGYSGGGYVWLWDALRFYDPVFIMGAAMKAAERGELHADKPVPECWPEWAPGDHVAVVDFMIGRSRRVRS